MSKVISVLSGALVPVDIDATIVTSHFDKQQAAPTWKKTYGFHPVRREALSIRAEVRDPDRDAFMHIETESAPLWIGEETGEQVARDLDELGFDVIASGVTDHPDQRNIVVVSRG